MLAYRHLFHAGNFADVFKHALLARLLIALGGKSKPYCYLDTHAGTGRYDLAHEWAWKTREFETGIGRLWERRDIPAALAPYFDAVRAENPKGRLRFYPGSPLIALSLRRPGDRIVLAELNRKDCAELEAAVGRERHVAVHCMDGYQALKAFLPPPERRGLVLLDSSFDRSAEFRRVARALKDAHDAALILIFPDIAVAPFGTNRDVIDLRVRGEPVGEELLGPAIGTGNIDIPNPCRVRGVKHRFGACSQVSNGTVVAEVPRTS